MKKQCKGKDGVIIFLGMLAMFFFTVSADGKTVFSPSSLVRQKCGACHQLNKEGRMEVIEETRKTPEEWKVVVDRMNRLNDVPIDDGEFKTIIKEVSYSLCLSPEEMSRVAYITSDENSQYREKPKDELEQRIFTACVRCHTFGKIASHRMTRNQWEENRNLHLGYVPTVIPQMREMDWAKESQELVEPVSERFPFDNPEWEKWMKERKDQDISGKWTIAGYEAGKGYYEGSYTFKANAAKGEDEYLIEKEVRYESGEVVNLSGEGTLYSEYHLRYALSSTGSNEKVEGVFDLDAGTMEFRGKWWKVLQDRNVYGDEEFSKGDGGARMFALYPRALSTLSKGEQKITVLGVGFPEGMTEADIQFSDANVSLKKVERVDEAKIVCFVTVGGKAAIGTVEVSIKSIAGSEGVIIYDKVEGIRIYPQLGRARVSCGEAYPSQGVQFVARGVNFGLDKQPDTADDVMLEPVKVRWWLEEEKTGEKDDDLKYLEAPIENGCYTPVTTYGPIEERYQHREGVGLIAVGAAYSEGGKELKARALLVVTEPDFVTHLK